MVSIGYHRTDSSRRQALPTSGRLWLALCVLDLLHLHLLPMQLVHIGDHIHALPAGWWRRDGRLLIRGLLAPVRAGSAKACARARARTPARPSRTRRRGGAGHPRARACTSMRTKEGTGSSSSLSAALKAPVAEPWLMKSFPSAHVNGGGGGRRVERRHAETSPIREGRAGAGRGRAARPGGRRA